MPPRATPLTEIVVHQVVWIYVMNRLLVCEDSRLNVNVYVVCTSGPQVWVTGMVHDQMRKGIGDNACDVDRRAHLVVFVYADPPLPLQSGL